jgi:hypothetical protein
MAFPPYDGFSRSVSRRQSLGYPTTPISYSPQGMYTDPMMHRSLGEVSDFWCFGFNMLSYLQQYPQPSYQIYGPPASTIPVSHRLTGPCKCYRPLSMFSSNIAR